MGRDPPFSAHDVASPVRERKLPVVAAFALAGKMALGIRAKPTRGDGYRDSVTASA